MTPSLWRELAVYAAIALIIAGVLCHLDGRSRIGLALGVAGGLLYVGGLTIQMLGIA